MVSRIGITTTIPVEVLLTAGHRPLDLNNAFINSKDPHRLINLAEQDGFPLNCCTWIKGIYGVVISEKVGRVICVTGGDCSNTEILMEVLKLKGVDATPFSYPQQPNPDQMEEAIKKLAFELKTTIGVASEMRIKLKPIRDKALELDKLTWQEGLFSGWDNHYWLVSCSDFNGDYTSFSSELSNELIECYSRKPYPENMLRLAYIGVPPIFGQDFFRFIEQQDARIVYNEVQRQFAMPLGGNSLAEQYSNYTYPYPIYQRIADIKEEISIRKIDAIIHYVQAFCHRAIGDIILKDTLDKPVLTIEGNDELYLHQQVETRIEAFLDAVKLRRQKKKG
jgi:benzoyl-CoA reductase/2-hydroxyglutaryl-CoA dehydratase subunit BcrC/BadD/HgdB